MPELHLGGCHALPLMSYLKSLGIMRLVHGQADSSAHCVWKEGVFTLLSKCSREDLIHFFMNDYRPSPIVVPWSGGDFFSADREPGSTDQSVVPKYPKTPSGSEVIKAFQSSKTERLEDYRKVITTCLQVIRDRNLHKDDIQGSGPKKKQAKASFLTALRSRFSDNAVAWIDVAAVVSETDSTFNVLLGSGGGNDGNIHFSDNFMQNLWDCLPDFDVQRKTSARAFQSQAALASALFGDNCCHLISKRTAALYDGGSVGGPNATQGMERDALTNPWDFILAIEGTLCLAGALARRSDAKRMTNLTAGRVSGPAFPFSVRLVSVGIGSSGFGESNQTEIWLPLWARPMGCPEMILLFSEGRADLGRRRAVNGAEFVRAVASLGVDLGITEFHRYGIVKGRVGGENYHSAVPLGGFQVRRQQEIGLLEDLDKGRWLTSFRRACSGDNVPSRFPEALRRLDTATFSYCKYGRRSSLVSILTALGGIELELAVLRGKVNDRRTVRPIPPLSPRWIKGCDDSTPEFRIAMSLASIQSHSQGKGVIGPLRCNLESVDEVSGGYMWSRDKNNQVVWQRGLLSRNLVRILERRMMDASRLTFDDLPLDSCYPATLNDVMLFIEGRTDDRRISELLWGGMLVNQAFHWPRTHNHEEQPGSLSRAYALLKLLFLPRGLALRNEADGLTVRAEPSIVRFLITGRIEQSLRMATRRLIASGFSPMPTSLSSGRRRHLEFHQHVDPLRLAAALLIPVRQIRTLKNLVLSTE